MKVLIYSDYDEISDKAAIFIRDKINKFSPTENKPFVLGLPTGSTPIGVYKKFIEFYNQGSISFKNVVTFNMDEYVGLDSEHLQSYAYFMYNTLFKYIDIKKENINLLNGSASDLKLECLRYEEKIKSYNGINLFLCGIGQDGHIAFNEPGSSLNSRTRIKTLCYDTIQANSRFFEDDINSVPKQALTVGIKTIMDSQEILLLISGTKKALALHNLIEQPISFQWTSSILQNHNLCTVLCDGDSTGELKVKTYRYFKNIQKMTDIFGNPYENCIKKYISKNDKILITSPHPDDDILGCGGIMQCFNNKDLVKILYMTNGIGGLNGSRDSKLRLKEALSALTIIDYSIENIDHLNLPFYYDKSRKVTKEDISIFEKYLFKLKPNHIFVCGDNDPKGTHLKCFNIIKQANLPESVKKIWIYKGAWDCWDKNSDIKENTSIYLNQSILNKKLLSLKMHLSQHPLIVNDDNNKDLLERCNEITKDDNNNICERFKVMDANLF
jgi:glucosamine-6-phosphate deaminase